MSHLTVEWAAVNNRLRVQEVNRQENDSYYSSQGCPAFGNTQYGDNRNGYYENYNDSQDLQSEQYAPKNTYTSTVVSMNATDRELVKKIRDKITSGWFSRGYDQVIVESNDGVVLLQGTVISLDDKDKVEKEVRNIDGVKSVNSQIRIQEVKDNDAKAGLYSRDTFNTSSDEQLNKKIRESVSKGILWDSYKEVFLNTNNGVVTLRGTVETSADQQKLINDIKKIEGVKSVQSDLKIKNS